MTEDDLPAPPPIGLEALRERVADEPRFLRLRYLDLVASYVDGSKSRPFTYDFVDRASLDAAVMAAHFRIAGERHVFLRSALRPPVAFRSAPPAHSGNLWELPAGLIDAGETPVEAARRELAEELGFDVPLSSLEPLGPPTLPAPGVIGELHYFFHVEVDPAARGVPTEDGSPLERGARVLSVPLPRALELCRSGRLPDAKTELALRRLLELP